MSEPAKEPRWLAEGRKRVAACEPLKVGSDPHLLEMAIGAYVNVRNERDCKEAQLSEIAGVLSGIDDTHEHEAILRRILAIVMRK